MLEPVPAIKEKVILASTVAARQIATHRRVTEAEVVLVGIGVDTTPTAIQPE